MEDKPRTDLGQAEVEKDLRRAATEGKCNFTNLFFILIWHDSPFSCATIKCNFTVHFLLQCMSVNRFKMKLMATN